MYSSEVRSEAKQQEIALPESTSSSVAHSFHSSVDIRQAGTRIDRQELAELGLQSLQVEQSPRLKSNPPKSQWATVGVHVLAGSLCFSTLMDQYDGTLFCWHPMLMTLGFVGLMSEGVLLAISFRALEGPQRRHAIERHALVQLASAVSIAVAFWAIWQNKVNHGKPHYTSWHGTIGLGASLVGLAVLGGGAVSFRKLGLLQAFSEPVQARIKLAHRLTGPAVFTAALVNVYIGLGHPAAGERVVLHLAQRIGVVLLGLLEVYLLAGGALLSLVGLGAADKLV